MTKQEFIKWLADHCSTFPQAAAFINESTETAGMEQAEREKDPRYRSFLAKWYPVLEQCTLDDALEATRRILSGSFDPVDPKDRAMTPTHYKRLCAILEGERFRSNLPQVDYNELATPPANPADWDSKAIMGKLVQAAEAGDDPHELAAELMPLDPETEHRYACLDCRDVGLVEVWRMSSMKLAKDKKLTFPGRGLYRVAIRCPCKAGDRHEGYSRGGYDKNTGQYATDKPLLYDPKKMRICPGFSKESVHDLTCWMEHYQPPKPANFNEDLDAWNRGIDWAP